MGPRRANRRLRLLLVLVVLAFGTTLARAVWLQAVRGESLGRLAARQQHETMKIPAGRGTIFDRLGVPAPGPQPAGGGARRGAEARGQPERALPPAPRQAARLPLRGAEGGSR